ncbi:outer membrane beta-barrel protein [Fulvivirgaceae bacterium BMA12]|uniref:Outer membrane beta-barrel protein n=1 Tax=Agaribacillus aureus TaxID=3051825 RepID=A0ABT8L310_9BACT|nr:outer membrane beta-barrel protein [Fulvivirgaceae bacterium BMA12]
MKNMLSNKKHLVLIIVILVSFARIQSEAQTYIGVKRGVSFSQATFDDVDPNYNMEIVQEQTQGDITGLILKFLQDKHAGLLFEFNMIDKGWTQIVDENFKYKTTLKYLNLYPQSQVVLGKRKFRLFFIGGPYVSYLYDAESSEIPADQVENIPFIYDSERDNKWDFGLGGGGGFSLETKLGNFQIDGKFSLGLSNIIEKEQDTDPEFSRNQTIEVSFSYSYPLFNKKDN